MTVTVTGVSGVTGVAGVTGVTFVWGLSTVDDGFPAAWNLSTRGYIATLKGSRGRDEGASAPSGILGRGRAPLCIF